MFWSDVSIVALESIMSSSGDSNGVQYLNVRERAVSIIKRFSNSGFSKEKMQDAVSLFLETRGEHIANLNNSSIPEHLIPAVLVALCVKNVIPYEIDDEIFENIAMKSHDYLSQAHV